MDEISIDFRKLEEGNAGSSSTEGPEKSGVSLQQDDQQREDDLEQNHETKDKVSVLTFREFAKVFIWRLCFMIHFVFLAAIILDFSEECSIDCEELDEEPFIMPIVCAIMGLYVALYRKVRLLPVVGLMEISTCFFFEWSLFLYLASFNFIGCFLLSDRCFSGEEILLFPPVPRMTGRSIAAFVHYSFLHCLLPFSVTYT